MAEAGREERGFYESILREFSRVIPWGIGVIVILLVGYFAMVRPALNAWEDSIKGIATLIAGTEIDDLSAVSDKEISAVKKNLKRAIAYSLDAAIAKSREAAFDPAVVKKVKQNLKKVIEFSFNTGEKKVKGAIFEDPAVKENLKRAIAYSLDSAIAKSRETAFDPTVVKKVKQNLKETFDFAFDLGERKIKRAIFGDPYVVKTLKVNAREAIDFGAKRLAAYGVGVMDSELQNRLERVEARLDAILEALKK